MQGALGWIIHAVLDAPVHDVANEGAGEKTQQLHDSKDGGVELNWARTEARAGGGGGQDSRSSAPDPQRRETMLQQPPSENESCPRNGTWPGTCFYLSTCLFHLLSLLALLCGERKGMVKES